jgi:hypothetical protein
VINWKLTTKVVNSTSFSVEEDATTPIDDNLCFITNFNSMPVNRSEWNTLDLNFQANPVGSTPYGGAALQNFCKQVVPNYGRYQQEAPPGEQTFWDDLL